MAGVARKLSAAEIAAAPRLPVRIVALAEGECSAGDLTASQEAFARAFVETRNASAALRLAYNVGDKILPKSVWEWGCRVANLPQVQRRVKELQELAATATITTIRELAQYYYDLATADPNELVRYVHRCCRYCHGVGHSYQWVDEAEFAAEYVRVLDLNAHRAQQRTRATQPDSVRDEPLPTDEGGYGYARALEPVLTCPRCLGDGERETIIADTTKLTGKARLLYKGMKETKNGIEVLMHDQLHARDQLGRMMGAFKDLDLGRLVSGNAVEGTTQQLIPDTISPEEAARAYLRLVS